MILLHDHASTAHAFALDLEPQLRSLLEQRIASLKAGEDDLTDWTEILAVGPNDTEADIVREVGFSPLVDPIDGNRFPADTFQPCWDWLIDHRGYFEMLVTFGSTFACILFIKDVEGVVPELIALCRRFAGGSAFDQPG